MANSFSLKFADDRTPSDDAVGTGLYLAGSYFDHSCSPNARAVFAAGSGLVTIVATDEIETGADLNNVRT